MSADVTAYNLATGRILRAMRLPDLDAIWVNHDPATEGMVSGWFDPAQFYVAGGAAVPVPPSPGPWAVFDYATGEWTDPRTPADHDAELQTRRSTAKLTKLAFIQRCMEFGILTPAEAIQATREIPDSFAAVVAGMPPMIQTYAAINWGGATEVDRMDPFILGVAAGSGLSDDLLDQLFGLTGP